MSEINPLAGNANEIELRQVVDFLKKTCPHRAFAEYTLHRNKIMERVIIVGEAQKNMHSPRLFSNQMKSFRTFTQELTLIDPDMKHFVALMEHGDNHYLVVHQINKFAARIRQYEKDNKINRTLDFDTLFLLMQLLTSSKDSWEERDDTQIISPLSDYFPAAVMVAEIKSCFSAIGISYKNSDIFSALSRTAGKYRVVIEANAIETLSCTTVQKLIDYLSDKQKNAVDRQFAQFQELIEKLQDIILLDNPMMYETHKLF